MTALGANLRPCAFTVPNWPDYDDSCGGCMGYGTWVSGGSWSTAEARAILAHYRQGRHDLAAGSMARILDPYAKLFKLDNPIAHFGCGPGMYSAGPSSRVTDVVLDVDVFGVPAAFLRGLWGFDYGAANLTLRPRPPPGVASLRQKFPAVWGNLSLFLSMTAGSASAAGQADPAPITRVAVNGAACAGCIAEGGRAVVLPFAQLAALGTGSITVDVGFGGGARMPHPVSPAAADDAWEAMGVAFFSAPDPASDPCAPNATIQALARNTSAFAAAMAGAGLGARYEAAQARAGIRALNHTHARCEGRLSGAVPPVPPVPAAWAGYDVPPTQQAHADATFIVTALRLLDGLANTLTAYRGSGDATEREIYRLWTGGTTGGGGTRADDDGGGGAAAAIRAEISALEARVTELRGALAALQ